MPLVAVVPARDRAPAARGRNRGPRWPRCEAPGRSGRGHTGAAQGPALARLPRALRPPLGPLPQLPAAVALAARESAGSGGRRGTLRCAGCGCSAGGCRGAVGPWGRPAVRAAVRAAGAALGSGAAAGGVPPAAAAGAAAGGAGAGAARGRLAPGGGSYSATPDAIIRTKDSAAAGARFLSPPATMGDWRPCAAACCSEPRYSMAVVELPRRPASPAAAAALGCCLVNCTARGRSVCKFALHRGYSSCSLCRAFTAGGETGEPHGTRVSTPLEEAGPDLQVLLPWHLLSGAQEETTWAVHFGSRAK